MKRVTTETRVKDLEKEVRVISGHITRLHEKTNIVVFGDIEPGEWPQRNVFEVCEVVERLADMLGYVLEASPAKGAEIVFAKKQEEGDDSSL